MSEKKPFNVWLLDTKGSVSIVNEIIKCLSSDKYIKTNVISVDKNSAAKRSFNISSFHILDSNKDEWVAQINSIVNDNDINVLLPCEEPDALFTLENHDKLSQYFSIASLPDESNYKTGINKYKLAEYIRDKDIPCPDEVAKLNINDLKSEDFPIIAKPIDGSGGVGIKKINNHDQLSQLQEEILGDGNILIQKFMGDYDIDCSVFCKDGKILAHTIQKGLLPDSDNFSPPLAITFVENNKVYEAAEKLMAALNWSGIAHIDMRYDIKTDTAYIIEISGRYWASVLASCVAGVNFPKIACYDAIGQNISDNIDKKQISYAKYSSLLKLRKSGIKVDKTNFRHVIADPIPEISIKLTKLFK